MYMYVHVHVYIVSGCNLRHCLTSLSNPLPCHLQETNVISESQISLEDFSILKVIGRGSYAKVLMAELKATKEIYAMKVIKKSLVMDEEVKETALTLLSIAIQSSFSLAWFNTCSPSPGTRLCSM